MDDSYGYMRIDEGKVSEHALMSSHEILWFFNDFLKTERHLRKINAARHI